MTAIEKLKTAIDTFNTFPTKQNKNAIIKYANELKVQDNE